jgi:hypothetical protein
MLDHFGQDLLVHAPQGHPGCKRPQDQRSIHAVAHLDVDRAHAIKLHLGDKHVASECTTNKNYQPTVREVMVAPLMLDGEGQPMKNGDGRWMTGTPVPMSGAQLAERMRLSDNGRKVVGYISVRHI